jgi:hypothetical protein
MRGRFDSKKRLLFIANALKQGERRELITSSARVSIDSLK